MTKQAKATAEDGSDAGAAAKGGSAEAGSAGSETVAARLELPGSGTTPARVDVEHQPRGTRLVRAAVALLVSWALIPVVFFIPPHIPWVLVAFFGGLIVAWRLWRGSFVVRSFEAACPRCGEALSLASGTRIRGRHTLDCYNCHRQPDLVIQADG